jgi:hypothetical protein
VEVLALIIRVMLAKMVEVEVVLLMVLLREQETEKLEPQHQHHLKEIMVEPMMAMLLYTYLAAVVEQEVLEEMDLAQLLVLVLEEMDLLLLFLELQ